MIIEGENFCIHPFQGSEAEYAAVLEVYRQCEDFLALGPVAIASMEMVCADLALSKKEGGIFCLISPPGSTEVVGVIDYIPSGFRGDPSVACLELLMIAAPYRSHGLGAAVVKAVEAKIFKDSRVRAIDSGVQVNNPHAIRFWLRMGYQIISGAEPQGDGTIAYHLWKAV